MVINRDKHNLFTVKPSLNVTPQTDTDSNQGGSSSDGTTVIIGGGGTGLTQEQLDKLNSIESGAQVNQDAFSYYKVSDGTNTATQAAITQKDTANLTVVGANGISAVLVTKVELAETQFISTGTNTGVYSIKYVPVTVEIPPTEEGGEPTTQTTYPLVFTYVSGDKLAIAAFDTIHLYKNEVEVNTYISGQYTIDSDETGINSITIEQQGLDFDHIVFTLTTTNEETQEQVTTEVLVFDAATRTECIIQVQSDTGAYWQLDDKGNLYTTYNAYSTQELSAYGMGQGGDTPGGGGVSFLKDLEDVDVTNLMDGGILQYNSTTQLWEVIDGSSLEVDLTEVEQKITQLQSDVTQIQTTITNWTPIIEAIDNINDWFSFVDGKIRANYDLWGVGEISAYGIGEGSGSTGASFLSDLEDVLLSSLQDGQLLQYDSSIQKWVNIDKDEVGLNESELAQYLTTNQYITQSDLSNYVTTTTFNQLKATVDNHTTQITTIQAAIDLLNDMFEWDNGKIKAKADFYGIGEVSAYGIGEGSGSQGTSYLHELQDVSVVLNELTQGQLLSWDDTINKWVAVDKDQVGLNETELANYLTTNNYAKKTDITWNNVQNKPETYHTVLSYINDLGTGWLNILNTAPTDYVTRWPTFAEVTDKPTTLAGYGITDAYTQTEADGRYVNVTGDTMTGNLILPTLQANTSIILGSVKLEYDSTNKALKVSNIDSNEVINLYATGEVSAYGYSEDTPITGAQNLDDLDDVIISSATTGQALIFNGTNWVNQTIETGGLDEDELEQYLQNNNYIQSSDLSSYATMTWVSNNFLQSSDLSGYAKSVYVNGSSYSANTSGRITIPDYVTRSSVDSDGTQVISTGLRLKDGSNYGQYLYFGDGSYVYLAELTDDDLTIHANDLNLDVDRLLVNGEELALDINISNSGSGNVVTNVTASSNTLTVTKGFTLNSGSSGRLAYYSSSSTIDDYTSSIGSSTRLWYLSSGTPTDSSSTVGSNYVPVYLSSGTITASTKDFMVERGVWKDTSSGNWNNIMTPGMYALSAWGTNGPTNAGYNYGTVAVFKEGSSSYGGAVTQVYFPHANTGSSVYAAWRSTYELSSSRWQTWHYLLDTGNAQNFLGNYYVKKTGDSMTGALYISSSGFSNCLSIRRTDSTANASIVFRNSSDTILGHLGLLGSGSDPNIGPAWWNSSQTRYNIASESNHRFFYSRYVDLRGYSTSNFYPYVFTNDDGYTTDLEVAISSDSSGGSSAYNANHLHFFIRTGGWSDNGFYLFILNHHTYSNNEITIGSIGTGTQNGGFAVWLRGGVGYIVRATGRWAQSDIYTSSYSYGGSTYTVGTKYSGGSNSNVSVQWTPAGLSNIGRAYMHGQSLFCQSIYPRTNGSYECGGASNRWSYVYAINGNFSGNVVASGEVTAYQTSDIRLKTNIQKLNAIDVVRKMNIVQYDWTEEALEIKTDKNKHGYGLIAQELDKLVPEAVGHNMFNAGYWGINYDKLVPFALSAIQTVDDEVSMLKRRVTELEDRLSKYESIN